VIEKLFRGSAINTRAFFMQDYMYVDVRCKNDVKILELPQDEMQRILRDQEGEHAAFAQKVLMYQNKILKQEQKFPLDYIMQIPKQLENLNEDQISRENALKNVVMRIIIEIRERKKRPKLSDFLNFYRDKKHMPNAKEEFQKKFRMLYSGEDADAGGEDPKFDKLIKHFDRIQKQLSQQQQALSFLVKKVNNLIERRDKKEKAILEKRQGGSQTDDNQEARNKIKPHLK
jgi:hypothetical protein